MDTNRMHDDEPGNAGRGEFEGNNGAGTPAGDSSRPVGRTGATSALMRDAARLRSVMVQAGERGDLPLPAVDRDGIAHTGMGLASAGAESQERTDLARAAGMPSLPDLDAAAVPSGVARHEGMGINVVPDELPVAETRRPTSLRMPAPDSGPVRSLRSEPSPLRSAGDEARGATTLRPIDAVYAGRAAVAVPAVAVHAETSPSVAEAEMMPVFTEIERKENYSYGTDERTPAGEPATGAARMPAEERSAPEPIRMAPSPSYDYARSSRGERARAPRGRGAVTIAMVLAGTAIGIGLYAGGGDFLSGIFSNSKEGVSVVSPSTVTERPVTPPPPTDQVDPALDGAAPAPAPQAAMVADTNVARPSHAERPAPAVAEQPAAERPAASHAVVQREPIVVDVDEERSTAPRVATSRRDTLSPGRTASAPKPAAPKPLADAPAKAKADDKKASEKAKAAAALPNGKTGAKDGAGKFMVQVRATPDEAEAKLIAKRLRSKGAGNVTIVPTKAKNGSTFYKIRYNATGSSADAQLAASRAGYKDVWVVKQK